MKLKSILIVIIGLGLVACNSKEKGSADNEEVSGAYAREYSCKVINPESGKEIGMRTFRDTIYIRKNANGYEVSNNKWSINDYDKYGWKNMEHANDRPMSTFLAKFDSPHSSLISELSPTLHFDEQKSKLFKSQNETAPYH